MKNTFNIGDAFIFNNKTGNVSLAIIISKHTDKLLSKNTRTRLGFYFPDLEKTMTYDEFIFAQWVADSDYNIKQVA